MEEALAVNRIEITEKLFQEAVREPLRAKYSRLMTKVACGMGVLLLILCVVTRLMGGSPLALAGEVALVAAVLLWLCFSLPRTEQKRVWNRLSRDGPPHREIRVFEDRFTVRGNDGVEDVFAWDEVTASRTTGHLLILKLDSGREVMLDRSGFSTGSESEVLERIPQPVA